MSKKYISLGLLAATLLVWLIAPLASAFFVDLTALDLMGAGDMGLDGILLIFAPIAAIVLGALGAFVKPALTKLGGLIGGIGYAAGFVLYLIGLEFELAYVGWGAFALLALLVANLVISLKAE